MTTHRRTDLDIRTELQRTQPAYVVYVPKSLDGSTNDTGNEHILVGKRITQEWLADLTVSG